MRLRTFTVEFQPTNKATEEGFWATTETAPNQPGTMAAIDFVADTMDMEARHITHPNGSGLATAYHGGRIVGQFSAKRVRD